MYKIDFGNFEGRPLFLDSSVGLYSPFGQSILQQAHVAGLKGYCTCTLKRPAFMVKSYPSHYSVARYPRTAHLHSADCPYFEIAEETSGSYSYRGALTDTTVKLHITPFSKEGYIRDIKTVITNTDTHTREVRSVLSLKGLLHHIWERQGLNKWSPHFKSKRFIASRVLDYGYQWAGTDMLISKRTMVLFPSMRPKFQAHNYQVFKDASKRIFVVGYLSQISRKQGSDRVLVKFKGSVYDNNDRTYINEFLFYGDKGIEQDFYYNYPFEYNILHHDKDNEVVCMLCVEYAKPTQNQQAYIFNIKDITFMAVCGWLHAIPITSSDELLVVQALIDTDRAFKKPMAYDDSKICLPNLILTDTSLKTPMCVETLGAMPCPEKAKVLKHVFSKNKGYASPWIWLQSEFSMPDLPNSSLQRKIRESKNV